MYFLKITTFSLFTEDIIACIKYHEKSIKGIGKYNFV